MEEINLFGSFEERSSEIAKYQSSKYTFNTCGHKFLNARISIEVIIHLSASASAHCKCHTPKWLQREKGVVYKLLVADIY